MQLITSYHQIITSEINKEKERIQEQIDGINDEALKELSLVYEPLDVDATFSKEFLPQAISEIALPLKDEEIPLEIIETDQIQEPLSKVPSFAIPLYITQDASLSYKSDRIDTSEGSEMMERVSPFSSENRIEPRIITSDELFNINALNLYGMFSGATSPPNVLNIDELIFGKIWPAKLITEEEDIISIVDKIEKKDIDLIAKRKIGAPKKKKLPAKMLTEEEEEFIEELKHEEEITVKEALVLFPELTIHGADRVELRDHQVIQLKETKIFDPLLVKRLREKQLTSDLCGSQPQTYIDKSSNLLPQNISDKKPSQIDETSSLLQFTDRSEISPRSIGLSQDIVSPIILPFPPKRVEEKFLDSEEWDDEKESIEIMSLLPNKVEASKSSSKESLKADLEKIT